MQRDKKLKHPIPMLLGGGGDLIPLIYIRQALSSSLMNIRVTLPPAKKFSNAKT